MSDPVSAAKAARESLARALAAIQSDPGAPPTLMTVAEPVSTAMGALFQIERSGGAAVAQHGPQALEAVRRALALLQQQPPNLSAAQVASEAVAGALGFVHGLAGGQGAAPKPAPAPVAAPAPAAPAAVAPPVPVAAAPAAAPSPAAAPPARGPQAYAATQVAAYGVSSPAEQQRPPPQVEMQRPLPAAEPQRPPAVEAQRPAPAPRGGAQPAAGPRVDAELGAHSASNFYKGLSGNDIVEHGGLFVSTYKVPPVGQAITLHVSMPGGYEFDALAVVKWTRDTVESGQGAPPGFGAQFTQITPEARQLVYRYVRNREPLFHDDL